MTGVFPPQDLECPNPTDCPVAVVQITAWAETGDLSVIEHPLGDWYRVYDARDGYGIPNPGYGDSRFSPFDALGNGSRVPAIYLAQSLEAALLESSLHDVGEKPPRVVAERTLLGKMHARIAPPRTLRLADLRDSQLDALGLQRKSVSSSSPEHYPCTRRIARAIHAGEMPSASSASPVDGIVWHSRQAEITEQAPAEVAVVFADRVPSGRDDWELVSRRGAAGSLLEGAGRLLLDELAENLAVTISLSGELDAG